MKLAKLSLAAIMTVGALSTANAQPLEEAIKGVDFSGFARYRFHDVEKDKVNTGNDNDYDVKVKLVAPVTDNLKLTTVFTAGGKNVDYKANKHTKDGKDKNDVGSNSYSSDIGKMWFTYKQDALTVTAGRQAIGTPVTDNGYRGDKGDGVVAMYNLGSVTLAAAYFNTTNYGANEVNALAAIGSFGAVNAQVWYVRVVDSVDHMVFVQVDGKVAGVSLKGQVVNTKLKNVASSDDDSGTFYALKAGYKMDNFSVNAGYTATDKDMSTHALAKPADTDVIVGGWRLGYNYPQLADTKVMFLNAGVALGKFGVAAGYAQADIGSRAADDSVREMYGKLSYKYAKNFNTYVKYSDLNDKISTNDQKYIRFEAKYSF